MKVYIGPYRSFSTLQSDYETKIDDAIVERDDSISYDMAHKHYTLKNKLILGVYFVCDSGINWFKHKINYIDKRRIHVKIDDYDVWSADHTLAHIIHPTLVKLKEVKHGAPLVQDTDVPLELRNGNKFPDGDSTDEEEAIYFAKWDWVIGEMIFAFEKLGPDQYWEDNFEEGEVTFEKLSDDSDRYTINKDNFKEDVAGKEAVNMRIANGLRLFGVYYQHLWD